MNKPELTLDLQALRMVAGYAHWFPITQGLYRGYFRVNMPGWNWNDIIPLLIKKKIVVPNSKDPSYRHLSQGLYISTDVKNVRLWVENGKVRFEVSRNLDQERMED